MQRTIKFRAWDKEHEVMTYFELEDGGREAPYCEKEVMQYIELKDKNGKEIHEGDIVEDTLEKKRAVIRFSTEQIGSCGCCWDYFSGSGFAAFKGEEICFTLGCDGYDAIVIGNIYENPELLENK